MSAPLSPAAQAAQLVDSLGPAVLAKAQAYTLGNHALVIAGVAVSILTASLMIRFRMLERVTEHLKGRSQALTTFVTGAAFFALASLIALPWTLFTDWKRERDFGFSTQPLGDFIGQLALIEALSSVLGGLFMVGIYALIRRAGARWWAWAAGFSGVATVLLLLAAPSLVMPLLNDFEPVPPGEVRTALEKIADDAGIPHDRIYMYDGSRQSEYFTANVSGIGPSARIAISDVALKQASLDEVKAVTGHEAGHYVLGHVWRYVVVFPLLAAVGLWLIQRLFVPTARLLGSTAELHEPRGLPVFMALVAVLGLLAMPLQNYLSRIGETEADRYSLTTVNAPDALASALIKTAEYRNPRPLAWEELLFYTHPSVEKRVLQAMEWKAAHPAALPIAAPKDP